MLRPRKYKSEFVKNEFVVSMRQSRLGDLFYMVEFVHDERPMYVTFDKMSSVIDFIHSNFQCYDTWNS